MKLCSNPTCDHAGIPQPFENFGRNDSVRSGHQYYCKRCATRIQAAWKKAHPEKTKTWRKAYVERNKERNRLRREAAQDETRYVATD